MVKLKQKENVDNKLGQTHKSKLTIKILNCDCSYNFIGILDIIENWG